MVQERTQTTTSQSARTSAIDVATSGPIVKLAARTSLLVGSVLNLINQGEVLFGPGELDPVKLCLTYLVPYCVTTYSATTVLMHRFDPGPRQLAK